MTYRARRRPPGRGRLPGRRAPRYAAEAEAEHHRLIRLRFAALLVLLALAMTGLAARLVSLHVVQASALEAMAERQQLGRFTLEPRRGRLLDRSGRPLAINVEARSVFAVPSKITDRGAFARAVAPVLRLPAHDVEARLTPGLHFVWLARKVSPEMASALRARARGEQIGFVSEARRVYPNGELAAHLLGFAGIDNQGLAGAELAFDRFLRGRAGLARVERDAIGRPRFETRDVIREPTDGADVVLTIDQVIQHIAERELDRALATTRARWGTVLIMEPRSGDLLALATAPRFDPNAFARAVPAAWVNRAVGSIVEPGSTFKVVLAAAALESGVVDPREVFVSTGELRVAGGHVIHEAHNRRFPRQTLADIVRNSSNVGAAMVATRLGRERFHDAIRRFGFGQPTGVDLPGEAAGLVAPPSQWLGSGLQTIGFGQGLSATPLQLLAAGAAIANEGVRVRPRVLRAVRDAEGRALQVAVPEVVGQAAPPVVARQVLAMMEGVVTHGTGTLAQVEGYRIAGKTGTAQKPGPDGRYLPDRYIASFLGIVPADRPQLVVLVMLDDPRGEYYGGAVAAPVFRAVVSQVLWHLRVPPSATEPAR
jgi:cell division protein FtsI/penicillin-binding protein 2